MSRVLSSDQVNEILVTGVLQYDVGALNYKQMLADNEQMIKDAKASNQTYRLYDLLTHRSILKDCMIEQLEAALQSIASEGALQSMKLQSVEPESRAS